VEAQYSGDIGTTTTVVHATGAALEQLYDQASIGSLFMEPIEYRQFAAPMKMYEYLGHGKPIIATEGTLVGDFVEEYGVGWSIPYRAEALAELLNLLEQDHGEYESRRERVELVREEHTWAARARRVVNELTTPG